MMDTSAFTDPGQEAFPDAELLPLGGSTCQCYRVKLYGKLHFLKRLKPELQTDPRHVAALNKEFETGYCLEHPNLVRYISRSDDGILMDYVDGATLSEFTASHPDFFKNSKNADRLVRQLVEVVGYLHSHQIVHLDLKPDNILITRIGHDIKLIDLGYCYTDAWTDTMGRTDSFAAPEQLDGSNDVDARTDIYAIGRILQTLPCAPFYHDIIDRCTRPDKSQRFPTVTDVLARLDRRPSSRRWMWMLLVPLIAVGAYLYQSSTTSSGTAAPQRQDTTAVQPVDTLVAVPASDPVDEQEPPSPDVQLPQAPQVEVPPTSTVDEERLSSHHAHGQTSDRAQRLEKQVQDDIDDLYRMVRSGQLDPMNLMYMKQSLPRQIRELIELYRQEGKSEKVSEWYYKLDVVESVLGQIMT